MSKWSWMNLKNYKPPVNLETYLSKDKPIEPKKFKKFIAAIPFKYFENISNISAKAWVLFTYIWFLYSCSKETRLKLPNKQLSKLGINPTTKKRNLEKLETAGYLKIENQKQGASVEISLLI